jgi:hypothetical protein
MAKFAAFFSVACSVACLALPLGSAYADDYDAATRAAIRSVISKQLDALSHEDAKGAESYASDGIRKRFQTPTEFFDMVKKNYAALLHPRSTHFGATTNSPHGPLQTMTIIAADGTVWSAIYSLEQADGSWRISGCGLQRDENEQAI